MDGVSVAPILPEIVGISLYIIEVQSNTFKVDKPAFNGAPTENSNVTLLFWTLTMKLLKSAEGQSPLQLKLQLLLLK